ncbi:MAG TPA: rRNA (cytidine-2'-O-)-methyltransferase, partial [Candidatus Binatia bacterium]
FLPAKKRERREKLQSLRTEPRTLVFYEAPHRIGEALEDMAELFGARQLVLGREVTKVYEEFIRGSIGDVIREIAGKEIRGEITLVVSGFAGENIAFEDSIRVEIQELVQKGLRVKEIAEVLGEKFSYPKKDIYRLVLEKGKK